MSIQDLEKIFQDKIDKEIKIEPKDWMPEADRKTNIRPYEDGSIKPTIETFII